MYTIFAARTAALPPAAARGRILLYRFSAIVYILYNFRTVVYKICRTNRRASASRCVRSYAGYTVLVRLYTILYSFRTVVYNIRRTNRRASASRCVRSYAGYTVSVQWHTLLYSFSTVVNNICRTNRRAFAAVRLPPPHPPTSLSPSLPLYLRVYKFD